MRSFVLTALLSVRLGSLIALVAACGAPSVDGDALGDDTTTDAPARNTPVDAGKTSASSSSSGSVVTDKLTLTVSLTGTGTITSSPAGVTCTGTTCTGSFARGTPVSLSQTSTSGTLFGGWGGACTGNAACSVTLDSAKTLTASFVSLEGKWTGLYTNTRTANGCTFNNKGNLEMDNVASNGSLASSSKVDGLEIRENGSCNLQTTVKGASNDEALTVASTEATGTWSMAVQIGGTLPFPYKVKVDADKLVGTWTCTGCSGGFSLTKSP